MRRRAWGMPYRVSPLRWACRWQGRTIGADSLGGIFRRMWRGADDCLGGRPGLRRPIAFVVYAFRLHQVGVR